MVENTLQVNKMGMHNINSSWDGSFSITRDPEGDPRCWLVSDTLIFYSSKKQLMIAVKPGFPTDGASVPKAFWWYASPLSGDHAPAALIHDGLYSAHLTTRAVADDIFLEALFNLGVRKTKAKAMYASVRSFGDTPWNKKERLCQMCVPFVEVKVMEY